MTKKVGSGLLRAMLDAVHGSDEKIGGQAVTRLRTALFEGATEILVESTIGFGEFVEATPRARIVVGGELIDCDTRDLVSFSGLTRGIQSTKVASRYPAGTIVYDLSENTSALDLARRGFFVNFALGSDLDVVGRNLGLVKCVALDDATWRDIIRNVAYLAKQPLSAILIAMNALQGPGNFDLFERTVSSPNRFFVSIDVPLTNSLQGRFFLNSGEAQDVEPAAIVNVTYPITSVARPATAAVGLIRVVSGAFLIDGENFVLNDGANPPVTFEFDDDASVAETPTLRAVPFTATDTEAQMRDAIVLAVTNAAAVDINAAVLSEGVQLDQFVGLTNQVPGVAGNVAISTTVADPLWSAAGMAGGADVGVIGVTGVFDDTPATREGLRDGLTNYFTGGSFVGQQITLGTDPGAGTPVLVDYSAHPSHYLAPDEAFINDGTDFPPYFADNLLAAQCLLDQVRAAGVGVELSAGL